MEKKTLINGTLDKPNLMCNKPITDLNNCTATTDIVQVSALMGQQITEVLIPINFPTIDFISGSAVTYNTDTSTFTLSQAGIYQMSFKCTCIKTSLDTPDVGMLVIQDGNIALFNTYETFTIGRIASVSLSHTSFIRTTGSTTLQLATGAMFTSYSSCVMAVYKVG
ncbi:hypothetical protein PV797_10325 [Clostridiaceae bacterium M8S5]|nr:hypothetical protein PV797_10325 [Clostridiaceae bacterium M8S5]